MPRPIIGVSGGDLTPARQSSQASLRRALHGAGCVPILLRPGEGEDALNRVHGLVLPGGGDIDPRRYGQVAQAELRRVDPAREEFELSLARSAVAAGAPVLGICLGQQVLVVALGGTLVQDVSRLPAAIPHEGDGVMHEVRLDPGSRLARVFGAVTLETNSSHHQAPGEVPPLLAAVGRTRDGVVEAVEGPGFTVGVGWHPETLNVISSQRLLAAFVGAAEDYARRRGVQP